MNKQICFVVSSEESVRAFLLDHIEALSRLHEVTVIVNTADPKFLEDLGITARVLKAPLERKISPFKDWAAFRTLFKIFVRERFDVVHSITPKAGLLAMTAAFLARIPRRVHTFTGQVWVTRTGPSRAALKFMDRLLSACATDVLADGLSQRNFLIKEGIVRPANSGVLANGSIRGVDTMRFRPSQEVRCRMRKKMELPEDAIVVLFLGRLTKDKGLLDLSKAFAELSGRDERLHLVVVGPDEEGMQPLMLGLYARADRRMRFVPLTRSPEKYMAASDIFCLPSYREGFNNVVIEAAAAGLPVVGSRIYGIVDAIEDNVTGLLFDPGNVEQLKEKILFLAEHADFRREMGTRARARAVLLFSKELVISAFVDYYDRLLAD